ncbi:hypothetical protein OUZ56_026348 [Daphnia magna]|uniref:Uncharacterized protein n=1 Tax=Daphnia magna TaxID=35525 RepID=A0ABQ9ZMH2_9CRUS|nr:hypothetical protein OUZ56_026348 [Daphnia magna]
MGGGKRKPSRLTPVSPRKVKTHGITKYKLMVPQCIHIEYKSKNSWYNSVFTLNTKVKTHGITIEVKTHEGENSWYNSVFTLNTKYRKLMVHNSVFTLNTIYIQVNTHGMQCIHIEYKN